MRRHVGEQPRVVVRTHLLGGLLPGEQGMVDPLGDPRARRPDGPTPPPRRRVR